MKKKYEQMLDVINALPDDIADIMQENHFPYMFSKAYSYVQKGPSIYRKSDYFNQPSELLDKEDLDLLELACQQVLKGKGFCNLSPFEHIQVNGFGNLIQLFHFEQIERKTKHSYTLNGRNGILDCIKIKHVVDGRISTLYNFCEYNF